MKKSRLLILPAIALCMSTAACEVDNRTPIAFWHTFSDVAFLQDIVNIFEEENPEFRVILTNKGGYDQIYDATTTAIAGDAYPDLVIAYPDHVADYIASDVAVDWNYYIDNEDPEIGWTDEDKAKIVDKFMDEGTHFVYPGTFTLPFAKSTECLYFNEEIFLHKFEGVNDGKFIDQAYMDNLTWDELFGNLIPAIQAANAEKHIYVDDPKLNGLFAYDSDDNFFITLAEQYGYGYTTLNQTTGEATLDFNNPDMKALLKKFNGYYHADMLATKGTCNGKHTNKYFEPKKFLFTVGSTGGVKYHLSSNFNVGVANLPRAHAGDPAMAINQGPSICMLDNHNSAVKRACWELYKVIARADNSAHWSLNTGYMPINKEVYSSDEYDELIAPGKPEKSPERLQANVASYSSKIRENVFLNPAFPGSAKCRKSVDALMTNALKLDPKDKDFDKKLDALFKKAIDDTILAMNK